jgi:hypothetical protein
LEIAETHGEKGEAMHEEEQTAEAGACTRRRFLQLGAAGAAALGAAKLTHAQETAARGSMMGVAFEKREPRVAVIGTGGRGTSLLGDLLAVDAQIAALCDIVPEKAEHAAGMVTAAGQKKPALYTQGPHHVEELTARNDVDLILVATPWNWHAPIALASMNQGKDVAIEVPGVTTIDECWQIVHTSEQTRKHCMILENCCYGYNETLILRMIYAGLFGELLYGEGAYIHDLREELFSNAGEGLWRRTEHTLRNGNLYPTHGLGPVANYMGVQRGDRFASLVSMSSPERGLDAWRKDHLAADDLRWKERYICGDMNTSLIQTAKGLTITVKHAVSTPHPYDRINLIAGTKGLFQDYPPRIYFDGMNKDESFGTIDPEKTGAYKQYQHPLWEREGDLARKSGGHGGMDLIMIYRLMQCVREGLPPDLDVYDCAAWASVAPLSVDSVRRGSAPVEFPDFTGGKWKERPISAIATQA